MKASYLIIGALFIIGPYFFLQDELINLKIDKEGKLVKVEIVEKPNSCIGTKAKWFMKVNHNGQIISKQMSSGFCEEHNKGDIITVKYLNGYDRILLPEDNIITEFISIAFLALFGFYVIYLAFKKPTQRSSLIKK